MIKACAFCTQVAENERTITENNLAWAFLTNIPITPGHTLVVPRRCVATFAEMTQEEQRAVLAMAERIQASLAKALGAEGFNVAWNQGEVGGQSIPHFHLHIVPRKTGDEGITEYDPRRFLYRPGSREVTPEAELAAVAALIRARYE